MFYTLALRVKHPPGFQYPIFTRISNYSYRKIGKRHFCKAPSMRELNFNLRSAIHDSYTYLSSKYINMKKTTTFLSLLMFMSPLFMKSQEITLEMPNARGFSGVKSISSEIVFTTYFGEKTETKGMANFVLKLYDKELNEIKTTDVEVSKYSELASSAFTGKYFLFIFVDALKKTRTSVVLDKDGEVLKTNVEEDVRRALLVEENFPIIHVLNEEEFILFRPMKEKKFGFEVERLNKDLESSWKQSFIPESGVWTAVDSKVMNGNVYFLQEENPSRSSDNYKFTIHCLSAEDGSPVYDAVSLDNGEDGGAPAFIRVGEDGTVATGGMYFKKSKYNDKNSDGLFFARVSKSGQTISYTKNSWDSIKSQISGEFSSALLGGKTKIMVEDVIRKTDGSFMVICEQFKKANNASMTGKGAGAMLGTSKSSSATGPEVGFTVLDFVFFNFSATGELSGIDVVAKENKEARVTGKVASEKGLAIANFMLYKGFFSYKELIMQDGKQVIVYRNDDGFKSKLYFLEVGAKSTEGIPSVDMDRWVSEKLNKVGKFAKATGANQYTFDSDKAGNDYALYKNAAYFKPGYMLMSDYSGRGLKVWLEPIPKN